MFDKIQVEIRVEKSAAENRFMQFKVVSPEVNKVVKLIQDSQNLLFVNNVKTLFDVT